MGNTRNLGDLLNADSTIATADVADGGITTAKLADTAVTTAKITDANISTAKLADDAVTQAKIGADAVGTTELANDVAISTSGAITTTGAFTSTGIDDNADATAITIDSNEKVGIGTASPQDPLHTYLASGQRVARFEANNSTSAFITFKASNTSLMPAIGVKDEDLFFSTGDAVERARFDADSNGDLILQTGNLVIGTSGKGIDFSSASGSASGATASVLDDYETGTMSLEMGGLNNISVSSARIEANNNYSGGQAFYEKIGNLCYIQAYFFAQQTTTQASGNLQIKGLPFTAHANGGSFVSQSYNLTLPASDGQQVAIFQTNGTTNLAGLRVRNGATWQDTPASVMPNNTAIYFRIAGVYKTQ